MTSIASFRPLQGAIAQAESWTHFLNTRREESNSRPPEVSAASLENIVWAGVLLGELLPFTWRVTFDTMTRSGNASWISVKEFEAMRQEVRRLFFTAREALDHFRSVAETFHALHGRRPAGMDRLVQTIDNARQLEETVFRDWPSFAEPLLTTGDSLPVDEALAEALGVSVAEARRNMEARRRELDTKQE